MDAEEIKKTKEEVNRKLAEFKARELVNCVFVLDEFINTWIQLSSATDW